MRNIWLVIKHDIVVILQQRSFWVLTILMPLILVGINAYVALYDTELSGVEEEVVEELVDAEGDSELLAIGLVDEAGLIMNIPALIPADLFRRYSDETAALAALDAEEIEQAVIVPADYLSRGELTVYDRNFQISSSGEGMGVAFGSDSAWLLQYLIDFNITESEQMPLLLRDPVPAAAVEFHVLEPPEIDPAANDTQLAALVASVMPYLFYFLLVMGGSYMMRSVVAEKENRTVELLLLSVDPKGLMIGKILAMSVIVLIQVIVWVGSGILVLDRGAALLDIDSYNFPPGFVLWAVLFLSLGFLLYAAIMTMVGAVAPTAREGAQMTWLLIIPLMPTLMFGSEFLENPHGMLSMILSLFPLSAPSAMVTRIAVADVPLWQIGLSLTMLALTTYGFVLLAGRFFRTDNLLSHSSFSLKRFATGWRQ